MVSQFEDSIQSQNDFAIRNSFLDLLDYQTIKLDDQEEFCSKIDEILRHTKFEGNEGIMIKSPTKDKYLPANRRYWMKFKNKSGERINES